MKKSQYDNIYYKNLTIENLEKMYNTVRKTYIPSKFSIFTIFEPKPRLVMSQTIEDNIVNHFIAN